jgi:hypothetical protein
VSLSRAQQSLLSVPETAHRSEVSIARLLPSGRPTAITRHVVTVVVDAVKRVLAGWAASHVGQERRERFLPAVTDTDASRAVVLEPNVIRIAAPSLHALPDFVFGRRLPARTFAVTRVRAATTVISASASATQDATSAKLSTDCSTRPAAIASAKPCTTGATNNGQSSKSLSNKVVHMVSLTRGANVAQ